MNEKIPPPPRVPSLQPARPNDFALPGVRVWFYAGPIIVDSLAMICTTILVAMGKLEIEAFKYLIGILVVGNVALRIPGVRNIAPPGGGGFIVTIIGSVLNAFRRTHGL